MNCTCNHLSTFAVLVDVVDLEVSLKKNEKTYKNWLFLVLVYTRTIFTGRRDELQLFYHLAAFIAGSVFDFSVYKGFADKFEYNSQKFGALCSAGRAALFYCTEGEETDG